MAKKQSMAEALKKNKRLRQQLSTTTDDTPRDTTLKVVSSAASGKTSDKFLEAGESNADAVNPVEPPTAVTDARQSLWVRHTLGLRPGTSMNLRDATDVQKKKKRRGLLIPGEPATEQEIADLGINWVLQHIGFKPPDER